jgi:ATP-binding cassette subfamily B protein RaxB
VQVKATHSSANFRLWPNKSLPLILQAKPGESGLACLAMVAGYYGSKLDFTSLRQKFELTCSGSDILDLIGFSEQLDLTCRPLRIKPEDFKNLNKPCILQWGIGVFVVVKSIKGNVVVIHDPNEGIKTLSIEQVWTHFSGVVLELSPTTSFTEHKSKPKLKFSDFWSKISGLKRSLGLIFTLSLLLQIFILASPYFIQLVIDDVILTGDHSLLNILALGFMLVLIFEATTSSIRKLALLQLGNQINIQLGRNLFHHLIRLPLQFFESRHMGDIVSRFGSLQPIKKLLTHGVIESLIDGLMAIITLMMILYYSPMLTVVVLISVALYALVRFTMYQPLREVMEQEIYARAEESTNFMESVRGIQTIKLFGAETTREGGWQNYHTLAVNKGIRLGSLQITHQGINLLLFGLENILVVYLAAGLVIQGGFSTGMLFAFIAYKKQFIDKITALIDRLNQFKMLGLHFERLQDIVLSPKENLQGKNVKKHAVKGKIELKNISFYYDDPASQVLTNLNLVIQAGESVAITGPSGSGKSTLLKLMLGLNKAKQGVILIDNVALEQVGHKQYRQQISAVMQEDALLSGTVADNIAFFEPYVDMDLVVYCAELASIHQDISAMPLGYNSLIADMGSRLSGGQKQRIILARALYKKPKIIFMDEATSHLDTQLEADINKAIKALDITRIIVAHRSETIASADRVVQLRNLENPPELATISHDFITE